MTNQNLFTPAETPFFGARAADETLKGDAVLFGAPHGTPYDGINNEVHAGSADVLRSAFDDMITWVDHWNYDLDGPMLNETAFDFADAGNLGTTPLDGPGNRALIERATRAITAAGAVPIMIGGDDSTPIPFLRGLAAKEPLTIVQVDAHIDWRQERRGEPLGFSSTMRRASEMTHVANIIQAGMRSIGSARRAEVELARDWGAKIIPARSVIENGIGEVCKHVPEGANCVITIDCDALDAALMPAVMAPSPGGLDYLHVTDLIHAVAQKANIAGFDIIEFVPARDLTGAAAITVASLVVNAVGALARS